MRTRAGSVMMLLAGGVIGPSIAMITDALSGVISGSGVDTLAELCMTALVVKVLSLEDTLDVRPGKSVNAGVSIAIGIDLTVGILTGALVRILNTLVSSIDVSADVDANMWVTMMTALEFITLPTS